MGKDDFNELKLLSQEDLIVDALRKLLRAYKELSRRGEITREFLEALCSFSTDTLVWYILWESGGAQRFTDILHAAGCSRSKLSDVLRDLLRVGLIRMVKRRYQAVSPAWLVRRHEPKTLKT